MSEFLYKLGQVWFNGELRGKIGGVYATISNRHWGIENILRNLQLPMQALGMQIISNQVKPEHFGIASPYGASAICLMTSVGATKKPTEEELDNARHYGKQVSEAVARLSKEMISK